MDKGRDRGRVRMFLLLPGFKLPPKSKISFWVSRIDGSRMHEVGYVPLRPDAVHGGTMAEDRPDHIAWLPDGKRLSFRYQDSLYTVPAD